MKRIVSLFPCLCLALLIPSGIGFANAVTVPTVALFELPSLSSALHVLPPIGDNSSDVKNPDRTITDYLKVSVWQVIGENDYLELIEFTSQEQKNGLDYIKLQNSQYHVNWNINRSDIGKLFRIYFTVDDLNLGTITYSPKTGRTVPIIFRINNPERVNDNETPPIRI